MKKLVNSMLLCLLLIFLSSASFAAVPHKINFQGVLKDNSGKLITGIKDMTFAIYDNASGGNPFSSLWWETQTGVTLEAGIYSVQLGDIKLISPEVFADGGPKYLGITIGSDPEMFPRIPIISVPYAIHAEQADSVNGFSADAFVKLGPSASQETSAQYGIKVKSSHLTGRGVYGYGSSKGVAGESAAGDGIWGHASNNTGLNYGVRGESDSDDGYGVFGRGDNIGVGGKGAIAGGSFEANSATGVGVYGASTSPSGYAGYFSGNTKVTGRMELNDFILIDVDSLTTSDISVRGGNLFSIYNTSSTIFSLKGFTGGEKGQIITLIFGDNKIEIINSYPNVNLQKGINWTPDLYDTLQLLYDGFNWYEICRSDNSP